MISRLALFLRCYPPGGPPPTKYVASCHDRESCIAALGACPVYLWIAVITCAILSMEDEIQDKETAVTFYPEMAGSFGTA